MTTFNLEFKRIAYINLGVGADSVEEAEEKAWEILDGDEYPRDADWELVHVAKTDTDVGVTPL